MRWKGGRRSQNVEDRRGTRMGRGAAVGGVGGLGFLIIVVLYHAPRRRSGAARRTDAGGRWAVGFDQRPARHRPGRKRWWISCRWCWPTPRTPGTRSLRRSGDSTRSRTLVLFTGQVRSACGMAGAAMGPFYCPGDHKLYIDLSFYDELQRRFRAPGDFAQAYVIAHEVGHHVQNLLGINAEVQAMQRRVSKTEANELSVRLELQADCLAGVWGYPHPTGTEHARGGRSRRGPQRRQRHRRRPHPAREHRPGGSRLLHPRQLGADG